MGPNLQLVFSHLPQDVTDEEFCEWYDAHLPEILSIPGFVSAQRTVDVTARGTVAVPVDLVPLPLPVPMTPTAAATPSPALEP